jgi:hypothetical protein
MRTLLALAALLLATPTSAEIFGLEVRGGAGFTGPSLSPFTTGKLEDASVDLIWNPPVNPLFLLGSPGLEVGASANIANGTKLGHVNLLWQAWVPMTPLYVEGGLGAATMPGTTACAVMPYATAGVGAQLGDSFTVTLGVDHATDFGVCGGTATSTTTLGAQVGIRF